ncbi:MAG: response regulator transcription factor [Deltaproteobacteria bacterium]|nr:response regulator transcription factor [Deltaproteobacteria bacterium]
MLTRVLLVDDHSIVREGLKVILGALNDVNVVGEAADARSGLEKVAILKPDVVIMDISMPELNGIEATRKICRLLPSVRVIILSMHHTNEHIFRAMRAGAKAYILKESAGSCVVNAVRAVMRGQVYFGDGIIEPPQNHASSKGLSKSPFDSLSRREREIMQLVVEGNTNSMIATQCKISPKSVETYRSRLMLKLGINDVPSLVLFALQHGVISL